MIMTDKRPLVIYLLGAGRSGTTLVSIILNSHINILTLGEMHQFLEYIAFNKSCSCGEPLNQCKFWKNVLNDLNYDSAKLEEDMNYTKLAESHRNIPKLLINGKRDRRYLQIQERIIHCIEKYSNNTFVLDSSKYISRYLLLKRSENLQIKGLYVVRDVRGVIFSFKKNVQTSKKPLSTIIYYLAINFFGELVCRLDKRVVKIKYENLIENPTRELATIYKHVFGNLENGVTLPEVFNTPHLVGGNRMKSKKKIRIRKDLEWQKNISRKKQILYYFLAIPIMMINRYKI